MRMAYVAIAGLALTAGCESALNPIIALAGGGGTATHLAFSMQPVGATAGSVMPPVVVVAQNAAGALDTSFANSVSLALGANPGGGTLSGTTTVTAVAGVATFNDLSLNAAGTGYTLVASAPLLASVTSAAFNVTSP
jgi:hypothetical protein